MSLKYYELTRRSEKYHSKIEKIILDQHDIIIDQIVDKLQEQGKTQNRTRDEVVEKARANMYREFYIRIMQMLEDEEQDIIQEVLATID